VPERRTFPVRGRRRLGNVRVLIVSLEKFREFLALKAMTARVRVPNDGESLEF
jgi:hypothetical protein